MEEHPFKTISMRQLEEAFAAAITAITNTHTKVNVTMLKNVSDPMSFEGHDSFTLDVSLTSGRAYPKSSRADDEPIPF